MGVLITRIPSERNTSSKVVAAANFQFKGRIELFQASYLPLKKADSADD